MPHLYNKLIRDSVNAYLLTGRLSANATKLAEITSDVICTSWNLIKHIPHQDIRHVIIPLGIRYASSWLMNSQRLAR